MAWSGSKIFSASVTDAFNNTAAFALGADTIKASLFDNTITPAQAVAAASTAYGAGVWASGGVFDASGWPAAGRTLLSVASGFASNVYTFTAANTASANSATTLVNAYGCLIHDTTLSSPVSDQGICFSYFGGPQTVTAGQFTVAWNASGVLQITL